MQRPSHSRAEISAALALLAIVAFLPALGCGWVNWDDDTNFLDNADFQGLSVSGIAWAWKARTLGVFQPFSWIVLEAERSAWGLKPFGYHALSLLLHAANTVALFRVFLAIRACSGWHGWLAHPCPQASPNNTGGQVTRASRNLEVQDTRSRNPWPSAIAAGLWAIHPLRAEVVSWTSCQPYLPSVLCALLAILAYLKARPVWYAASLALYGSAVLFKGIAVTLPAVLLILDFYPLGRKGLRPWLEKLPFLAIGLAIAVVGLQSRGSGQAPWPDRVVSAGYAAWFYLGKTLAPIALTVAYPYPTSKIPGLLGLLGIVLVTALAIAARRRGFLACWLAYLVILAPNSGLLETHGITIASDRYAYAATMPLFAGLAAGLSMLPAVGRSRFPNPIAGIFPLVLIVLSWDQSASWKSSVTLYSRAEARGNAASHLIQNNLGEALFEEGRAREAFDHFRKAIDLEPHRPRPYFNVGVLCASLGRDEDAGRWFAESLRRNPRYLPAQLAIQRLRLDGVAVDDALPGSHTNLTDERGLPFLGSSPNREVPR